MALVWAAVIVSAIVVGCILALGLLLHPEARTQNRLFAATILLSLCVQTMNALHAHGVAFEYPLLLRLRLPIRLLGLSLFYLYVRSLTCPRPWSLRDLLHFIPFALGLGWYVGVLLLGPHAFFVDGPTFALDSWIRSWILFATAVGYAIACFRCVNQFEKNLPNVVSRVHVMEMSWLRILLAIIFVLVVVEAVEVFFRLAGNYLLIRPVILTLAMGAIAVFALRYSWVFSELHATGNGKEEVGLSNEQVRRYGDRLLELFAEQKPYLNPLLRLSDLADGLSLKPYQVSQVLTRGLHTSFFDLVNQYRVEEAKRKLADPALHHLSVLGVALDSGFNSKSSFAVAFRRYANETPSEFRARQLPSHLRSK